jgi:hypothetical protein
MLESDRVRRHFHSSDFKRYKLLSSPELKIIKIVEECCCVGMFSHFQFFWHRIGLRSMMWSLKFLRK